MVIQMISKNELANMYGISRETLRKRLNEIGITTRHRITPKEVEKIFDEFGHPESMKNYAKSA